ncbi:MAG: hypothetical protein NT167_19175 [Verrucomicrobia bacterium]|nr:hypothetical protein [Verrucomicrobiota bacterium]
MWPAKVYEKAIPSELMMKKFLACQLVCLFLGVTCLPVACADTIVLSTGRTLTGTAVRTNGDDVLLVMDYGAFNFSREFIKKIQTEEIEAAELHNTNRLASFKTVVLILARQAWASDLRPIPATVIDKGMLRSVPYQCFRCGDDYEVNIYGDLDHPAGIEAGVYRKLVGDESAKSNCVNFVAGLLGEPADREIVCRLGMEKDLKNREGVTFEITPPSAEDAYMGWWVSVYSERGLNLARASDEELKNISVAKAEVAKRTSRSEDPSAWTAEDLKFARPEVSTITFTTKSGSVISNAQVKPYVEGVSLIWRVAGGSGGIVKLADLPEDLRARFRYDSGKAAAAEASDEAKRARDAQALVAQAGAPAPAGSLRTGDTQPTAGYAGGGYSSSARSRSSSDAGSVYVSGYYRANGTYVHSYTRRQ